MKITRLAVGQYQFTIVMLVLLTSLGLVSFMTMSRSEDPQFEFPGVSVTVVWPGADPVDIEAEVVDPIEAAIHELDDLERLETTIETGVASTSVEFLAGSDPDEVYDDVVTAVSQVESELPEGVLRVEYRQFTPMDTNILQIALVSDTASYRELERQADRLEKAFERVPGIKKAEKWAFPRREVRVSADLDRMRAYGLTLANVTGAIQSSAQNIPGGELVVGARSFNLQTSGDYGSVQEIADTVVAVDGDRVVYLSDVADVRLDYADETHIARWNGQRSVFVTAIQRKGTNIFSVRDGLQVMLDRHEESLPPDIQMVTTFDQRKSVDFRVSTFFSSLVQGVLLVGIVMLLALGPRASTIVMILIPLAILIAISWVDWSGFALQQLSIVGLVIALGLLVDNAIVVVENTSRFMRDGMSPVQAALEGTSQIAWPIVSSTVTTILAFVPVVMMGGGSGDFVRSLPVTVIYTLIASLLLALTLTPLLASRLLRAPKRRTDAADSKKSGGWPLQRLLDWVGDGPYRRTLNFALRRPVIVLLIAVLIFAGSLSLFPLVGVSFFPNAEKRQFLVDVEGPEGSTLENTERLVRYVEEWLAEEERVTYWLANVGRSNPQVYYNVIPTPEKSNTGQLVVELDTRAVKETSAFVARLREYLDREPGATYSIVEFKNGPPIEAPIAIKVIGPELDQLESLASQIENVLAATPGVTDLDNPLHLPRTDLAIEIQREKAALLGIPLVEVDRTVRAAISGLPVAVYRDAEGEERNIVVRLPMDGRANLDALRQISVSSVTGTSVPLDQIATLQFEEVPSRIDHFELERTATVAANVLPGYSVPAVTQEALRRLEAEVELPRDYRLFVGGELEALGESFGTLAQALVIALLGIFGVLVLQFRSFVQPLIVFSAIPLAIVGAILALLITGYSFSFMAFIGLTSLVGIVVNNSIILVDYANVEKRAGKTTVEAATEAARIRFTPILLTTFTTIAGLLPLSLTGSMLWSPLGWAIIGGLTTSAFLTLIVVPTLYRIFTPRNLGRGEEIGSVPRADATSEEEQGAERPAAAHVALSPSLESG